MEITPGTPLTPALIVEAFKSEGLLPYRHNDYRCWYQPRKVCLVTGLAIAIDPNIEHHMTYKTFPDTTVHRIVEDAFPGVCASCLSDAYEGFEQLTCPKHDRKSSRGSVAIALGARALLADAFPGAIRRF